ncbi:MAG: hypothetical protein H9777_05435 [Candidatus Phocaeicola faecigallinarum]|uniref:Leucine-rich repeat domain-containing protein n=1 Tax=Candidatus Phocaeicola faecigallinarum TaxID=2838732 RepID=A0A948WYU4_9BACT|nr:hypothetical protein [Candidatus Phocaeicola faecigallinarum]
MKTIRILTLAVAAMLMAACNNEEFTESAVENTVKGKPVHMTFTADIPQTRTQLAAGNAVHWTEWDEIALWDGSGEYQKLMVDAESIDGSSATFSGPATPGADYTAFYPLVAVESMNATSVTFNLPAEQTAVAGTFASQLAPSLARATGGSTSLVFNNLCALVKFTAGADMAGEGTLTLVGGNATEALAGKYWLEYSTGNQSSAVKATRIALKGTFEAGKDYYFVVLPGTLPNGFSLLYKDSTDKLYRKATGKSTELKAGRILNLGELKLADGFEKAVIKEIYAGLEGGTASENADGTVTLSDADLTALAAMTELDLPSGGVTSLGGIGYCTGLTTLKCVNNQLTELNLNGLTQLTTLRCNANQLTTLDVSQLTLLRELWCNDNKLTKLDITRLSNLTTDYGLLCGEQKDSRQLTLTLTAAQATMWNDWWSSVPYYNTNVTLDVK